ncbi:WXG100 family type VII secretion target [Nocardioides coralli]|uniref:WXG100 family type VII secretion target n=1 Tax=Nocardioides coralli TaxID=2872154 RepID=UPI001CA3CD62|nr:hypothetical protein [Nocardioides coralli]QZY28789.1 hypothetical protein K6T13_15235 [Nocardioides coralli]
MSIETEIEGSPASIRSAAGWLSGSLRPAVERGGEALVAARRTASADWRGETAEAFTGAMSRAVTQTDRVEDAVRMVRDAFDDYADTLQRCQQRMAEIREQARAAGLTVAGSTVLPPGDGPAHPGTPPAAPTAGQAAAWDATVAAYNAHQERIEAYNRLVRLADEVWADLRRAWERVTAKDRSLDGVNWTFVITDVASGFAGAVLGVHGSILRDSARYFGNVSQTNLIRLQGMDRVHDAARYYDDLDHYRRLGAGAADDAARGARFLAAGKAVPLVTGGLLTGVGVWYDMEHGGESAAQAVTSNVGGFAASVAAGAAIGSIGGPVGIVGGIVIGAGVGVFTSGMIDGLWESGGDVGEALMAGADTIVDTGGALLEGAGDVGGAIVDGIGGLFD